MRSQPGAWVGWAGDAGEAPGALRRGRHPPAARCRCRPTRCATTTRASPTTRCGRSTTTSSCPASFHRDWWSSYQTVNQRFAEADRRGGGRGCPRVGAGLPAPARAGPACASCAPTCGSAGSTTSRSLRSSSSPSCRGARSCSTASSGPTSSASSAQADSRNFVRACRQLLGRPHEARHRHRRGQPPPGARGRHPDLRRLQGPRGARPAAGRHGARPRDPRSLGDPEVLMLGVDRLDYTKGIRHRLKAYEELLSERRVGPPEVTSCRWRRRAASASTPTATCATRSSRRWAASTASSARSGRPAVHYLHHSYPREEMAALFQAADVMLVTPLRDGMNLVAKEYVTCRHDLGGALVLSEFTGAWHELHQAFACNPHDIEGLKQTILRAINTPGQGQAAHHAGPAPTGRRPRRAALGGPLPRGPRRRTRGARPRARGGGGSDPLAGPRRRPRRGCTWAARARAERATFA